MEKQIPILVSFSGGRTSAFMAKYLKERFSDRQLLFVFANTGKEREETLTFVNECDKRWELGVIWLEASVHAEKGIGTDFKVVDFNSASRNGEPFEAVIKKYGLPSKKFRHCTRELKERIIHKYAKSVLGPEYLTALGIRADEKHRLKADSNKIYPLAEININEEFIRTWWTRQDFDLQLKDYEGNCDLCFLKSKRKKLTIVSENEGVAEWWGEMERKYATDVQSKFDEIRGLTIYDIVELAKLPFRAAIDKQEQRSNVPKLFDADMDIDFDCFCKSV